MKTMKKVISLMLVVMMVATMSVSALADDPITITVNNTIAGRKYEAYQVFAGTLNDAGVMADVVWGSGVNGADLQAALKSDTTHFVKDGNNQFSGINSAADAATVIAKWSRNETYVKNFADMVSKHLSSTKYSTDVHIGNSKYVMDVTASGVGYYFIHETTTTMTDDQAYTDYLLNITGATDIAPKTSAPTFTHSINYQVDGTYHEAMDFQVGDKAYYKMEATLPSLFNDYHQYHLHMYIDLPSGLSNAAIESVYVQHAGGTTTALTSGAEHNYVVENPGTGDTWELKIDFDNIKAENYLGVGKTFNLNDTIVVKYSATVNSSAVMVDGTNGTAQKGNVATATLDFSNDMNQPADTANANIKHGKLTDTASAYTYQIKFTKVDSLTKAPLSGAKFHLYRNVTGDGGNLVKHYAVMGSDGLITGWSTTKPDASAALVSSAEDATKGVFYIKGLDSLSYHLEEIAAPSGYNSMDESVLITLSATIAGQDLTALQCTADGGNTTATADELKSGLVTATVENTAGSTLPATGGIGTTIFYAVGAMLLLGSSVIFVMKKRNEG